VDSRPSGIRSPRSRARRSLHPSGPREMRADGPSSRQAICCQETRSLALLAAARARRGDRPCRRAVEQRDELAAPDHWITSSAQSLVLCWSPKLRKPSNREHSTLGLLSEIVHTNGANDQTRLPTNL